MRSVPRKPLEDIPANPVGAEDWHVQVERKGKFVKLGGSEGSKSFAHGFLVGTQHANPDGPELRLCDSEGRTYLVV